MPAHTGASCDTFSLTMDAHPLAALVPPMSKQELEDLVGDIAEHGLREEIITLDGMVLDGRHRLKACEEAGVQPRFRKFKGDNPAAFVLSVNLKRRHLSTLQRTQVARSFMPELQREAAARRERGLRRGTAPAPAESPLSPNGDNGDEAGGRRAAEIAAEAAGVSPRTIQRSMRVADADGPLAQKMDAGEISVGQAERRLQVVKAVEPLGEDAQEHARSGATIDEILEVGAAENPQVAQLVREADDANMDYLLDAWISKSNPVNLAKAAVLDFLGRTTRAKLERRVKRLRDMEALCRELAERGEEQLTTPLKEAK